MESNDMSAEQHNHEFRLRYRQTCKKAGYSQAELAEKSGLSISTLKAMKQGTMSSGTRDLVVQTLNQSSKLKVKITAEWLFEKWQSRQVRSATRPFGLSKRVTATTVAVDYHTSASKKSADPREETVLPDLLTPGESMEGFIKSYSPHVGNELAAVLASLSRDAIVSVERGDFETQTSTGLAILKASVDFPKLSGIGEYLAGEGLRLQADLESDAQTIAYLHEESAARYRRASVLVPDDPRPVRGLARIDERNGRFDIAEAGFSHAEGLVLANRFNQKPTVPQPALEHEHLRVARHKIHCLLDIRETNRNSKWNQANRYHELFGLVTECENLHNELMAGFSDQHKWWQIEWFMGLVFLAKAWGHLKQPDRTLLSLLHALSIRREMFSDVSVLSAVERSNIQWWIQVALSSKEVLTTDFVASVERLAGALAEKSDKLTLITVDDLVGLIRPPGERNF